MSMLAFATVLAATTFYPSSGDRPGVAPKRVKTSPRVDIARDMGPIVELTVRCPTGFTILSFTKTDRTYCRPKGGCGTDFAAAVQRACRGE